MTFRDECTIDADEVVTVEASDTHEFSVFEEPTGGHRAEAQSWGKKSVAGGQGSVQGQMVESHGTLRSHAC